MAKSANVVALKPAPGTNPNIVPVTGSIKSHGSRLDIVKKLGPVHRADFNMTLDFSGCSREDLIAMATDQCVIKIQAITRTAYHKPYDAETKKGNMGKDLKSPQVPFAKLVAGHMLGKFDVKKDLLANVRASRGDKVTSTAKKAAGMTPEQRKALAKMLLAMDSK